LIPACRSAAGHLVMLEGRQGRDRLIRDGDAFTTRRSGERFTHVELERLAAASPERFSGNVLPAGRRARSSRPSLCRGARELRYLALRALYGARGATAAPVPRWSGMLVEPRVDRVLENSVEIAELWCRAAGSRRDWCDQLRSKPPPPWRTCAPPSSAATRPRDRGAMWTRRSAADADPAAWRAHGDAGGGKEAHPAPSSGARRPSWTGGSGPDGPVAGGKPQERVLTAAPFLARYGPGPSALAGEIHSCTAPP
jgi:hypothetical protein